ncbi:hypothetical protein SAMN00767673_2500 [Rubrobacter radiotolerans DSM 5868]|nr:hypothetical protein SAMN00767673_2500 [Rubrobacter radiotolerans DSM 5868]
MKEQIPLTSLGSSRICRSGSGAFRPKSPGREPTMLPKGYGVYGRVPSIEKDGDPFTRRPPHSAKPGSGFFS